MNERMIVINKETKAQRDERIFAKATELVPWKAEGKSKHSNVRAWTPWKSTLLLHPSGL